MAITDTLPHQTFLLPRKIANTTAVGHACFLQRHCRRGLVNCSRLFRAKSLRTRFDIAAQQRRVASAQHRGMLEGSLRENCMSAVNDMISDFQDISSTEQRLSDGLPVHLQLKEGPTPKFCNARYFPFAWHNKVSKEIERLVTIGILSSKHVQSGLHRFYMY